MTDNPIANETFAQFRKSFFYGSRSNLNFKFIEHLSDEQADEFLQALFREIAGAYDEGKPERIYEHVLKWQTAGYQHQKNFDYSDGPFAVPTRPVK